MLRLAEAVYAAEMEAKPAAQPSAAAAAAPGEAGAEAAEASYTLAVEKLLHARAELEVRGPAARSAAASATPLTPTLAQPMLDIIAHLETNEHVSIVEVQRPRCARCASARAVFAGTAR